MQVLAISTLVFVLFANTLAMASSPVGANDECALPLAADIRLVTDSRGRIDSGEPFEIRWTSEPAGCDLPHYLIVLLPERVRFAGDGAMALAPGERAPHDIAYGAGSMRIAVPLHAGTVRAGVYEGGLSVIPFFVGAATIDWAVIVPDAAGGRIVGEGSRRLNVMAGAPKIVVQDVYAVEQPIETVTSASGDYRLDVFQGYFRVTDMQTGAVVVAAEGYRPGFSPTSRFLYVFGEKASQFRVFDLHSETLVVDLDREGAGGRGFFVQGLEWSAGDTFLLVAYEAAGAVGFKEMLFDRPFRYQAEGCGACSPEETTVAVDLEEGIVALGWRGSDVDGQPAWDAYSLLANGPIDADAAASRPLLATLDPRLTARSQRPRRFVGEAGEPEWFLNGPRTSGPDYRAGVPVFVADASMTVAAEAVPAAVGDWDGLRRGAVSLSRTERVNRDSRIAQRLAEFGIDLQPGPLLVSDRLTFLHMLDDQDGHDEDHEQADERYRIEPGRAALARGLASAETASAIDREVFHLTRDHHTCGLASPHRAFNGHAQLWTWTNGGRLHQVVHYHCYVSTGAIPAGIAFLITAGEGEAGYVVLGETVDGEMELIDSYELEPWVPEDKVPALVDIHMYGALRVFRPGDNQIALLNAQGSLAVYDIARREMVFSIEEVTEFANVVNVALTADGGHVVQINDNGRFFVHEAQSGAQILAGRYLDDEVVVYDEALRFDATPEGAAHVHIKFPGDRSLYELGQFEAILRSHDMARLRLAGAQAPTGALSVASPPVVALSIAATGGEASVAIARIDVSAATDLDEVAIYRDGRLVEVVPVTGSDVVIEREIPILGETRWLAARASDAAGARSRAAIAPVGTQPTGEVSASGRLFVVAAGTDVYDDPRISRLNYAASDARSFAAALERAESGYYGETFAEVLEDVPNLSQVLPAAIARAASQMTEVDTLFVYMAGHGLLGEDGGLYLADRATRADDVPGTALAWPRVAETLSSARGRVFIFLDTCHSGAAGTATNDDAVDSLLAAAEMPINVIAASKGRQFSLEGARFAGGVFTSALTAIFADRHVHDANGSGTLEFSELYRALKQRVVADTQGEQVPWISRSGLVGDAPVL